MPETKKYAVYLGRRDGESVQLKSYTVVNPPNMRPQEGCDLLLKDDETGQINSGKSSGYQDSEREAYAAALGTAQSTLETYKPIADAAARQIKIIEGKLANWLPTEQPDWES